MFSRLLKSCARPPVSSAKASYFSNCRSWSSARTRLAVSSSASRRAFCSIFAALTRASATRLTSCKSVRTMDTAWPEPSATAGAISARIALDIECAISHARMRAAMRIATVVAINTRLLRADSLARRAWGKPRTVVHPEFLERVNARCIGAPSCVSPSKVPVSDIAFWMRSQFSERAVLPTVRSGSTVRAMIVPYWSSNVAVQRSGMPDRLSTLVSASESSPAPRT